MRDSTDQKWTDVADGPVVDEPVFSNEFPPATAGNTCIHSLFARTGACFTEIPTSRSAEHVCAAAHSLGGRSRKGHACLLPLPTPTTPLLDREQLAAGTQKSQLDEEEEAVVAEPIRQEKLCFQHVIYDSCSVTFFG